MNEEDKKITPAEKEDVENIGLPIGMCMGVAVGTAIGTATDNMGLWMPMGLAVGMCLGLAMGGIRRKQEKDKED